MLWSPPRRIEGEAFLVFALDDLLQLDPTDREPLPRARPQERVYLYSPAGSQFQPNPFRPVTQVLTPPPPRKCGPRKVIQNKIRSVGQSPCYHSVGKRTLLRSRVHSRRSQITAEFAQGKS